MRTVYRGGRDEFRRLASIISILFVSSFILLIAFFPFTLNAEEALDSNLDDYVAKFAPVPPIDSDVWHKVPEDELVPKLQFLVDRLRLNYDGLETWSGSYDVYSQRWPTAPPENPNNNEPKKDPATINDCVTLHHVCDFWVDKKNDKLFVDKRQIEATYLNASGKEIENPSSRYISDITAIISNDELITYEYGEGSDQIRPELKGDLDGRIGKICKVDFLKNASYGIGLSGDVFDPRYFFISRPDEYRWYEISDSIIPRLSGKKKLPAKVKASTTLLEGKIDDVEWFYLIYEVENEIVHQGLRKEYVFNSESGYNLVSFHVFDMNNPDNLGLNAGHLANYVKIDDVYVPDQWLEVSSSIEERPRNFRYFKLNDCEMNKSIPKERFTIDSLELDDDVVVMNQKDSTLYEYKPDKGLVPHAEFGSDVRIVPTTPLWRSPLRLTAFVVGVALIIGGLAFKIRKKRYAE